MCCPLQFECPCALDLRLVFFFFKQKTAYEIVSRDWSSDVCSSDLLRTTYEPGVGPVMGEPRRLQQVVWNLLLNAVKFTPIGGEVRVRVERAGAHARVTVTDTGVGIAPNFLPYVFDRFRQGDQSTTRVHGGLGLGLSIVRHLVELHGGSVRGESEGEGKGSTFTVELPLLRNADFGMRIEE